MRTPNPKWFAMPGSRSCSCRSNLEELQTRSLQAHSIPQETVNSCFFEIGMVPKSYNFEHFVGASVLQKPFPAGTQPMGQPSYVFPRPQLPTQGHGALHFDAKLNLAEIVMPENVCV